MNAVANAKLIILLDNTNHWAGDFNPSTTRWFCRKILYANNIKSIVMEILLGRSQILAQGNDIIRC